jgi:nucleoside-diphosphate-sugar epimerase
MLTGARGFVGRHFLHYVDSSVEILDVSLRQNVGATEVLASAFDTTKLKTLLSTFKPDRFYHFAGVMKAASPEEYYRINLLYAKSILESVSVASPDTRVILIGSGSEYCPRFSEKPPFREDAICTPTSHYGMSKLLQTTLGLRYAGQGLKVFIPRIFNLLGPLQGSDFVIGRAINEIVSGENGKLETPLIFGDLGVMRDFLDVRDVCPLLWKLPQHQEAQGKVINICSGIPRRIRDLVSEIVRQAGGERRIVEECLPDHSPDHHWGDNTRLADLFGVSPKLSVVDSVREMIVAARPSLS